MLRHDVHEYQVQLVPRVECGSVTPKDRTKPRDGPPARSCVSKPRMYAVGLHWHFEVVRHVGRFEQHPLNDLMKQQKAARLHGAFVCVCIPEWDWCAVHWWLVAALEQLRDNVAVAIATMAQSSADGSSSGPTSAPPFRTRLRCSRTPALSGMTVGNAQQRNFSQRNRPIGGETWEVRCSGSRYKDVLHKHLLSTKCLSKWHRLCGT